MKERILQDITEMIRLSSDGLVEAVGSTTLGGLMEAGIEQFDFQNILVALEILHNVEIGDALLKDPERSLGDLAAGIAEIAPRNDRYWVLDRIGMVSNFVLQCCQDASSVLTDEIDEDPLPGMP